MEKLHQSEDLNRSKEEILITKDISSKLSDIKQELWPDPKLKLSENSIKWYDYIKRQDLPELLIKVAGDSVPWSIENALFEIAWKEQRIRNIIRMCNDKADTWDIDLRDLNIKQSTSHMWYYKIWSSIRNNSTLSDSQKKMILSKIKKHLPAVDTKESGIYFTFMSEMTNFDKMLTKHLIENAKAVQSMIEWTGEINLEKRKERWNLTITNTIAWNMLTSFKMNTFIQDNMSSDGYRTTAPRGSIAKNRYAREIKYEDNVIPFENSEDAIRIANTINYALYLVSDIKTVAPKTREPFYVESEWFSGWGIYFKRVGWGLRWDLDIARLPRSFTTTFEANLNAQSLAKLLNERYQKEILKK